MRHISRSTLIRFFQDETGPAECDSTAAHLLSCSQCWTLARSIAGEIAAGRRHDGLGQSLAALFTLQGERVLASIRARAWWAELRQLSARERLKRLIDTKALHTPEFFEVVQREATALSRDLPEASEEVAQLALALVELLPAERFGEALQNDFRAEIWTTIGNARRVGAKWRSSRDAFAAAHKALEHGTGDPLPEARLLSMEALLASDLGHADAALGLLERSLQAYSNAGDLERAARLRVKIANAVFDKDPERCIQVAEEALQHIEPGNAYLVMHAKSIQLVALIEQGRKADALLKLAECRPFYDQFERDERIRLQILFMDARLLELFEHYREAEKAYREVVRGFTELELYKDAFEKRVYLLGFYLSHGKLDKAAAECRQAAEELQFANFHSQMRLVWTSLAEYFGHRMVDVALLRTLRHYVNVYWRVPAADFPLQTPS